MSLFLHGRAIIAHAPTEELRLQCTNFMNCFGYKVVPPLSNSGTCVVGYSPSGDRVSEDANNREALLMQLCEPVINAYSTVELSPSERLENVKKIMRKILNSILVRKGFNWRLFREYRGSMFRALRRSGYYYYFKYVAQIIYRFMMGVERLNLRIIKILKMLIQLIKFHDEGVYNDYIICCRAYIRAGYHLGKYDWDSLIAKILYLDYKKNAYRSIIRYQLSELYNLFPAMHL